MLKEFRGHTSFVTAAHFTGDHAQVVSASSDGSVRLWDVRSGDCLQTFRSLAGNAVLPTADAAATSLSANADVGITALHPLSRRQGHYLICSRSNALQLINLKGEVVKTFVCPAKQRSDFVACCLSPHGDYLFAVAEDQNMYCFTVATAHMERLVPV